MRRKVLNYLAQFKIDDVQANMLVLAVDEVCANLIIHAHNCNEKDSLEINIEKKDSGITFEIKDKSVSFDFTKYSEPTLNGLAQEGRKGGIGLLLVRRIMDKIEFQQAKEYSICRLYKNLPATN